METLNYSHYEIREHPRSEYDPEATLSIPVGLKCPRCKTRRKPLKHAEKATCDKCDLKMVRYGNALECGVAAPPKTDKEEPADVKAAERSLRNLVSGA
jgi:hypothetical protein